jgi:hypothetical protein
MQLFASCHIFSELCFLIRMLASRMGVEPVSPP